PAASSISLIEYCLCRDGVLIASILPYSCYRLRLESATPRMDAASLGLTCFTYTFISVLSLLARFLIFQAIQIEN
ncbi:MAG: hypothetical protein O4808_07670, partial [Trichodesmium sp. St17_bin3_1_1]|nr:hypothetical protein [Trichodesmium sp. St17_bin3_1_1]